MTASNTASDARQEAGAVAGSMKDESKQLAQTATEQTRTVMHQVQNDVRGRANQEAGKIAETLHSASRQLNDMASAGDQQAGFLPAIAREGANAADRVAGRLDEAGMDGLFADVRSWARRNPGAFVFGAVAAGFVAGRIVRNASLQSSNEPNGELAMHGAAFNEYDIGSAEPDQIIIANAEPEL